jgi:hypothetical protein
VAGPGRAAATAVAAGLADALDRLASISPAAEIHTAARLSQGSLTVVVERGGRGGQAVAGSVAVEAQPVPGGDVLSGAGEMGPGTRSISLNLPAATSSGPWRVRVRLAANGEALTDELDVHPEGGTMLGGLGAFRATPSPRSTLSPVASFQFARTERLRFEWDVRSSPDRVSARLLDRRGQVLAGSLPVSRGEAPDAPAVFVDLNLAPFARGEYVVEVTAGSGAVSEQRFVAFRVVQ